MKTQIHVFVITLLVFVILFGCNTESQPKFNYENLITEDGWEPAKNDSTISRGIQRIKKEIWLMNFLHWRKLSNKNQNISVEYVKSRMNNLWGMQFTFIGTEGETRVNGHKAYYAEGKLKEIIKTRFIIWNCPESNRQFIADCNINLTRHTSEKLLNLQTHDITNSIGCHGLKELDNNELPQHVFYGDEEVSFCLPENWRSDRFIVSTNSDKDKPGHYPHGMTSDRGTVWNLLSDSEKEITFSWQQNMNNFSEESFIKFLNDAYSDTTISGSDTSFYSDITSTKTIRREKYFVTTGAYNIVTKIKDNPVNDTTRFLYKAFLWTEDEAEYLLSAGIVSYNNVWGIPVDLTPTEVQLDQFMKSKVLPNVINNPIK